MLTVPKVNTVKLIRLLFQCSRPNPSSFKSIGNSRNQNEKLICSWINKIEKAIGCCGLDVPPWETPILQKASCILKNVNHIFSRETTSARQIQNKQEYLLAIYLKCQDHFSVAFCILLKYMYQKLYSNTLQNSHINFN